MVSSVLKAYLWDNNQAVVEWLEKHLAKEDGTRSAIRENIKYLKRDYALKHIRRYNWVMLWLIGFWLILLTLFTLYELRMCGYSSEASELLSW